MDGVCNSGEALRLEEILKAEVESVESRGERFRETVIGSGVQSRSW